MVSAHGLTAVALQARSDSYYAATAHPCPEYAALEGDHTCDVCIVGAGITGCSAALHLAERGYRVTVLEAERVGFGASGRSGGQVIFGFAAEMGRIRALVGAQDARRLWDLSLEAVDLLRTLISRHAIDCDYRSGHLHAATKPRQARELREWQAMLARDYAYRSPQFLDRDALRAQVATQRYPAGLFDPNSGHLHPLNYTLGLARAAAAAGARFFEHTRVTGIETGTQPRALSASGAVRCRHLLLCGNAYLGGLLPELGGRIMPVGTCIVATEPLGETRARELIRNDMAVADINFVLDYFRRSADHRLLFGGRVSYSTLQVLPIGQALRARMLRVFPQLADVRVDRAWGGLVAITMNRAPHFGRLGANTYFAHGYSGHGIALSGLAGKLMAEAIAGTAERFDVFTRIPHRTFPGGRLLRTPALVLAMLYYRLRDLL